MLAVFEAVRKRLSLSLFLTALKTASVAVYDGGICVEITGNMPQKRWSCEQVDNIGETCASIDYTVNMNLAAGGADLVMKAYICRGAYRHDIDGR